MSYRLLWYKKTVKLTRIYITVTLPAYRQNRLYAAFFIVFLFIGKSPFLYDTDNFAYYYTPWYEVYGCYIGFMLSDRPSVDMNQGLR